jgi:hypothetical protein
VKKILKIIALILSLPIIAFVAYFLYLVWPSFFPKYPVNSCVEDTQAQKIHKITGFDDRYKCRGVPTTIFATGERGSIRLYNPSIKPVNCPTGAN